MQKLPLKIDKVIKKITTKMELKILELPRMSKTHKMSKKVEMVKLLSPSMKEPEDLTKTPDSKDRKENNLTLIKT